MKRPPAQVGSGNKTITIVHGRRPEPVRGTLSFHHIKRLFGYMGKYRRRRNILLALVIIRSMQLPLLAWIIGLVISGPITRLDGHGAFLGACGFLALAAFTQLTMVYRIRLSMVLGEDIVHDLWREMFRHLQQQPMSFYHRMKTGRIISRFFSDAEALRQGVQNVLFVGLVAGGQVIMASVLMALVDPVLFLVLAGIGPILVLMNRTFKARLGDAYRTVQESFSRVTATLAESVSGIRVTQGFARQDVNAGLFNELVKDHSRYNIGAARVAGVFLPMLEFNTQVFIALIVFVGGWRVFTGAAEVEALYKFVLISSVFFGPLQSLGNLYNMALTAMAGAERVFGLLDTEPEWTDAPGVQRLDAVEGDVRFDSVTFGYEPEKPVLHDICFHASPGQTIALVGHTGCGKSTITNLIGKFYLPTRGRITLDGHDMLDVSSDSIHTHLGVVLQQNFLFTGTVMDNIRFGRPEATDEAVIAVTDQLDCRDLIEALPDGFHTTVGESGSGISLGQRQLICFARALLANPSILILDEATSSIDTLTEVRVQRALEKLLQGRTSFVVAHRLSTIRHADQVLVMDQGRIIERGTHHDLVTADGRYAHLYRQFVRATRA